MLDPRIIEEQSIMPSYPWLHENSLDVSMTGAKIRAMQTLGVPYDEAYDEKAITDLEKQAAEITARLNEEMKSEGITATSDKEIIALIAYLQRLGTDIKLENATASVKP